ncbi:hypothetical protein PFLUV_G00092500 [Perca fluviatilis]|uniref:Uncharacterized protein n=1 Tax=Perca fluviatilis TaxID=8168 RepID=A0A6A5F5N7_PERFL|nr:hypothetical protein PFLUV_G00092500 [Perca fluviatilis]
MQDSYQKIVSSCEKQETFSSLDFTFLHFWTFVPETFSNNTLVSLLLLTLELISLLSFRFCFSFKDENTEDQHEDLYICWCSAAQCCRALCGWTRNSSSKV